MLGSPVGHSLSPVLHRAAYAALGLDWSYDAVEVREEGLPGFLAGLGPEWAGLSLTMPLKRAVLPLLPAVSPVAAATGAANTVVLPQRAGDNTDVPGLVAALGEAGVVSAGVVSADGQAAVLGGGATACSAVAALGRVGWPAVDVHVRSAARARDVVAAGERLGVAVRLVPFDEPDGGAWVGADVVVSTVPVGASAALAARVAEATREAGCARGALVDALYDPWPTPLATAWAAGGGAVVGGAVLLLHQAVDQVRLMTGVTPSERVVAAMRDALDAALAARAHPHPG